MLPEDVPEDSSDEDEDDELVSQNACCSLILASSATEVSHTTSQDHTPKPPQAP